MALTSKPLFSILDSAPNLMQTAFGLNQLKQGLNLELAGYNLAAQSFKNAGVLNQATAQYNAQLEELNLKQQLAATGRQVDKVIGNQRSVMATTGFALTSKSFLQVANETLSSAEKQVVNLRNTSAQKQEAIMFSGKVAEYQNQAKASAQEYAGKVARYKSESKQAEAYGSIFKQGVSLLGSLYGNN